MFKAGRLTDNNIRSFGLVNVHLATPNCYARGCVVHKWTHHHMRELPLIWRQDRRMFERVCEHGVGHPDPDAAQYNRDVGWDNANVHGCDGCCEEPDEDWGSHRPCRNTGQFDAGLCQACRP